MANEWVWLGERRLQLPPKAFAVLRYLIEHPGRLVSKTELLDAVWADTVVSEWVLTTCMREIRQALNEKAQEPRYIETVHRRGYRFIGTVVSQEEVRSEESGVRREEGQNTEQAEGLRLQAEGSLPASPSGLQLAGASVSQDSLLDTQDSPSTPKHSWSLPSLLAISLGLLVSIMLAVQYFSLRTSSTQSPTPNSQSLPLLDKPSLIVLPLVNLSGDSEQEYFSDGLTEMLTSSLSCISSLFVIARNSAFTYKGKAAKVQDVSREQGEKREGRTEALGRGQAGDLVDRLPFLFFFAWCYEF
jgi:DNA-binding winged helix-turn-helix (wHTH) protein